MLNDLPSTLDAVRGRLEGVSIVDDLTSGSCLKLSQDADVYFLGELQMLDDILSQVTVGYVIRTKFAPVIKHLLKVCHFETVVCLYHC